MEGDQIPRQPSREIADMLGDDALADALASALQITMRKLMQELQDVFRTETLNLELRLRSSCSTLPILQPRTGSEKPRLPQIIGTPESILTDSSSESIVGAQAAEERARRNRFRRRRKRRLPVEVIERNLMEAAFEERFREELDEELQGPNGPSHIPSRSSSLNPVNAFDSPMPEVQEVEDDIEIVQSSASTYAPRFLSWVFLMIPSVTIRLCGVVPWSGTWKCSSAIYRWTILSLLCGSICLQSVQLSDHYSFEVVADACLTIGTLLSLLGCGAWSQSSALVRCVGRLDAFVRAYDCEYLLNRTSCIDLVGSFLIVIFVVGFRAVYKGSFDVNDSMFAFACLVISGIACHLVRMCTTVAWLVDSYCARSLFKPTFAEAVKEWYLLDSLCRLVCSTLEYSFVFLQLTAMAMVIFLFVLFAVHTHKETWMHCMLSTSFCFVNMIRVWVSAAVVSEKCQRVPRLFTQRGNGQLDVSRGQVVEYIQHCQSGFYIFGMRINCALILKMLYIFCAGCFTMLSRFVLQS